MIDESLIKSNFVGRDGFRWWIGQVAPESAQSDQLNDGGWGNRVKVRIMGYHTASPIDLPNEDLPWAQIMLPTTSGTGAANYAVNPKLRPGDVVIGFFLDGDNAQLPIIMGALGRTSESGNEQEYTSPFVPFTGYTTRVAKPDGAVREAIQTNEATPEAQRTPLAIPPQGAGGSGATSAYSGIGRKVVFADSCEDTTFKTIESEIDNLVDFLQKAQGKVSEYRQKIQKAAEVIKSALNWVIGKMMKAISDFLVGTPEKPGIIPRGLQALYVSVYASTYAATGDPAIAHTAGYKSNEVFVIPIQVLEKALSCVANLVVELLKDLIIKMLESLLDNIEQFVTCVAEQFIGSLLNTVVDQIANGLSSALDGISGILSAAFSVADFLRGTIDAIKGLGALLDCNQSNTKCDGTKEWVIGVGPKSSANVEAAFENIYNVMNSTGSVINGAISQASGALGNISDAATAITGVVDIFNGNSSLPSGSLSNCYTGPPTTCSPPIIKIFGGGGSGAEAVPIIGAIVDKNPAYKNVTRTGSIIGAKVTSKGSGYRFPPFVEITDSCGLGYGAKARSVINKKGQVIAIYLVAIGENYPAGNEKPHGVVDVVVQSPGFDYDADDIGEDNLGNLYDLTVENGRIIAVNPINIKEITDLPSITVKTKKGIGAILKPVLGEISGPTEVQTVIDCPV